MEIQKVQTKQALMRFIHFPHQLYKNDENYVPELNMITEKMLSKKNPFLKHSEIALFLAIKDGNVLGRIAAIYNKTHLETYRDNTGFFGFFDSVEDRLVAEKLFKTCEQWLGERGIKRVTGPANLTTNDSCGFLLEGFQYPPMVMMPYNKAYYNWLCTQSGFTKLMDLNSYLMDTCFSFEKYGKIYSRSMDFMKTNRIKIRNLSEKTFQTDIAKLRPVYNKVNENNWGFMPLNDEEFYAMAEDLKTATPFDLTLIVEKEDEIVGFLIAVPNLNQAFQFIKNGKLFPLGILKLLYYQRKIDTARIMILGVLDEYKSMGIDLVLYKSIQAAFEKRNIITSEACYVLESNQRMNSILKKLSNGIIKKYRIYEKEIHLQKP